MLSLRNSRWQLQAWAAWLAEGILQDARGGVRLPPVPPRGRPPDATRLASALRDTRRRPTRAAAALPGTSRPLAALHLLHDELAVHPDLDLVGDHQPAVVSVVYAIGTATSALTAAPRSPPLSQTPAAGDALALHAAPAAAVRGAVPRSPLLPRQEGEAAHLAEAVDQLAASRERIADSGGAPACRRGTHPAASTRCDHLAAGKPRLHRLGRGAPIQLSWSP